MRSDMGKCVTERPRSGSSNPSAKARWYGRITQDADGYDYDGFTRLPVSRKQEGYHKKIGDKNFSDVLGPIQNYLRSSVGRRWNDVFSEISATLGRGTWPVRHVLTAHIDVATCTFRGRDGFVHSHDKWGEHKLSEQSYSRYDFYVEPETGVLRETPHVKRAPWHKHEPEERVRIPGTDDWYISIKGIWYIGSYRDVAQYAVEWVAPRQHRSMSDGVSLYVGPRGGLHYPEPEWPNVSGGRKSGTLVFVKAKQANKRELRTLREIAGRPGGI